MLAMLRKDLYVMGRYTAYLILSWLVVTWAATRFLEVGRRIPVWYAADVLTDHLAEQRQRR